MILPKPVLFAVTVALAIAEALQQAFITLHWVNALVTTIVIFFGVLGVQAATPAQIAAKIPAHVAALIAAFVSAVNAVQQLVPSMPRLIHIIIGVILVVASTLGIQVTRLALTKAGAREQARNAPKPA